MRLGFSARLAILFALLVALTALVTGGFASASTDRRVKDNVDQFLRERALDIAEGRRRPQRPRPEERGRPNGNNNRPNNNNDGNGNDGDECNNNCIAQFCGDSMVQPDLGEECDDGNNDDNDDCTNDCMDNSMP